MLTCSNCNSKIRYRDIWIYSWKLYLNCYNCGYELIPRHTKKSGQIIGFLYVAISLILLNFLLVNINLIYSIVLWIIFVFITYPLYFCVLFKIENHNIN